jgi:thiamine biosynthesis lipoprotein ApbE
VWGDPDATRHHLIDPGSGECATSGLAGVCVVTSAGWWAEVLAKAAFLAGGRDGSALLDANGAAGVLVDDDGVGTDAGPIERFRP